MNQTKRNYPRQGRTYRRFDLQFPVRIRFQSGGAQQEVEGISKNISVGGLLVRSTVPIQRHTSVSFIISLHGSEAVRPVHVMGEGEVVRLGEQEGAYLMAVRCDEPVVHLEDFLRENDELGLTGHNPS